ncbi:MAG: hypothetical protein GY749_00470 [Desulfobacteraceae bacterium]|nr:hypothetical protein [Desulfobacteraceae bacterium]
MKKVFTACIIITTLICLASPALAGYKADPESPVYAYGWGMYDLRLRCNVSGNIGHFKVRMTSGSFPVSGRIAIRIVEPGEEPRYGSQVSAYEFVQAGDYYAAFDLDLSRYYDEDGVNYYGYFEPDNSPSGDDSWAGPIVITYERSVISLNSSTSKSFQSKEINKTSAPASFTMTNTGEATTGQLSLNGNNYGAVRVVQRVKVYHLLETVNRNERKRCLS